MAELISVIIPVYNHGPELLACLASLEKQTYRHLEVIIVDDASTQPVAEVIGSKTFWFPHQLIRFEQNQDAPTARNEGFTHAKGDYIIFLDADILLDPQMLARMHEALVRTPSAAFCYSSFFFGRKLFRAQPFDPSTLERINLAHTSSLLRREFFPGFDPAFKKFQDWDLWWTIVERGGTAIWIDAPLFTVGTSKTRSVAKSHWLPSFAYKLPWPLFGYMPEAIQRYRAAEKQLREKHGSSLVSTSGDSLLPPLRRQGPSLSRSDSADLGWVPAFAGMEDDRWTHFVRVCLGTILLLEFLSAISIFHPHLNSALALIVAGTIGIVSIFRPTWALAFLSMEFIIGSKGGLLKFGGDAVNDGGINLRVLLFAAFMLGWVIHAMRTGSWKKWGAFLRGRKIYLVLVFMLVFAFVIGVLRSQRVYLIPDANAWGVWLLLLPVLDLATTKAAELRRLIPPAIATAFVWMCVKTLAIFYIFAHGFTSIASPLYDWVRRTGVGEMTRVLPDSWIFRVFFQSHIYAACVVVGCFVWSITGHRRTRSLWIVNVLAFATLLVSLSRSLWIGTAAAYLVTTCVFIFQHRRSLRVWLARCIGVGFRELLLAIASLGLVALLVWFPPTSSSSFLKIMSARADTQDDASQSRWELIPVLAKKIAQHPILGSGFGSTVTYQSHDPRLIAAGKGIYTTYTVEWGWLEFWIKFGIFGIPVMLAVLVTIFLRVRRSSLPVWTHTLVAAIFVLLIATHVFTPYLNHPLGFFLLMIVEGAVVISALTPGQLST